MKNKIFLALIVVMSLIAGFFVGQTSTTSEQRLLQEVKEKCRTADQKGKAYFKKYGNHPAGKEPVNSPEWVDAQSWEQACTEALEELRALFVVK